MNKYRDLNSINDTIARSKSVVQESLDLTRKNSARKKEIERRLKNCFNYEDALKYVEDSFTLDLENAHLSLIHKEKSPDRSRETHQTSETNIKNYMSMIDSLQNEKDYFQNKFEEMQDFVRELEEENLKLKSKVKILIGQVQVDDDNKIANSHRVKGLSDKLDYLEKETERFSIQNLNLLNENTRMRTENGSIKEENLSLQKKIDELTKQLTEAKSKDYIKQDSKIICETKENDALSESSTENYLKYFKHLKEEILDIKKKNESTPEIFSIRKSDLVTFDSRKGRATFGSSKQSPLSNLPREYEKNSDKAEKYDYNDIEEQANCLRFPSCIINENTNNTKKKLSVSYDNIKFTNKEAHKAKPDPQIKFKSKKVPTGKPRKLKKNGE